VHVVSHSCSSLPFPIDLLYFPYNSVNTTVLCCDMFLYVLLLVLASESKRERSEGPLSGIS